MLIAHFPFGFHTVSILQQSLIAPRHRKPFLPWPVTQMGCFPCYPSFMVVINVLPTFIRQLWEFHFSNFGLAFTKLPDISIDSIYIYIIQISVRLSIYPSIHPSIYLSIHPSIYLSNIYFFLSFFRSFVLSFFLFLLSFLSNLSIYPSI